MIDWRDLPPNPMTNLTVQPLPFTALGPSSRFWLDAFDPQTALHELLPVGPLDSVPFPEARLEIWRKTPGLRQTLVTAFESLDLPYSDIQSQALERLGHPDSVVVVTGQQPGAMGGPRYTFNKILSAIVFSQQLEVKWGIPVIPVLWDGGDDHDLAEVDEIAWPKGDEGISRFHFGISGEGAHPAWSIQLTNSMRQSWEQFLETVHPPTEYRQQFLEWTASLWGESHTWCDLFDRFWLKIFANYPLLIVRPWEALFRKMAREILSAEVEDPRTSMEAVAHTTTEVVQAGYKPQVHKRMGVCNFFYLEGQIRRSVTYEAGQFRIEGREEPVPQEELRQECTSHPEHFSPNALLRPVVQDAILPGAAVVLGPAEIAYHTQLKALYTHHSISHSWVIPRLSLTFMTAGQKERMEELGLSWTDLKRDEAELVKGLTSLESEDPVLVRLQALGEDLGETRRAVTSLLQTERPHLVEPSENQLDRMEKILHQVQDLLVRDTAKRDSIRHKRIRGLKTHLLPEDHLQERLYGLPVLLCRHGFDWIDPLVENALGWKGDSHFVITIGK